MSPSIQTREDILRGMQASVSELIAYADALAVAGFEKAPEGKWSCGQVIDHLIRSIRPLQPAFALPKFSLRLFFGKANRPSRTYTALVEKYNSKLAAGGRAPRPFIPPAIGFHEKNSLIKKYRRQERTLCKKITRFSEQELDRYILPHPLLGKLTLREMLFFTIYHNYHHLALLKKYAAQ